MTLYFLHIHVESSRGIDAQKAHIGAYCLILMILPIHLVDFEIFHWRSENFDVLVALDENTGNHQVTHVSRIHPLGTMNV